ncbi:hypothetical protein BLA29_013820 [Euroglyphus maynei]|uniref:Uncharacterized protein n=1 Tax=Euroglyphus maynei TaxID=6958 RepID=A0A1Y3BKC9_EURMA|nr:hypothetical protein BLA29_013820 [Euroglyphus maynei]
MSYYSGIIYVINIFNNLGVDIRLTIACQWNHDHHSSAPKNKNNILFTIID